METRNVELVEADARVRDGLAPGAYVGLVARDDGIGMTEEVVSHAFEPFFATKEETGGTGLGVSTVYGIVKQSDGYIEVESQPGSGSAFKILLPRVRDHVRVSANASASPGAGTGTILLVEDDAAVRGLANSVLAERGYHVLEASDGGSALRLLGEHSREARCTTARPSRWANVSTTKAWLASTGPHPRKRTRLSSVGGEEQRRQRHTD